MSGLRIGDIVMVGGSASATFKALNAGKFRTVVGFKPEGYVFKEGGYWRHCHRLAACLDHPLLSTIDLEGCIVDLSIVPCTYLVKINPGDGEDEILTKVGKPEQTKYLERF